MDTPAPSRRHREGHGVLPPVKQQLEVEDLSRMCRRDSFCVKCVRAFCSHCCRCHHSKWPPHTVIPVDVDATGQPTFSRQYPQTGAPIQSIIAYLIAKEDYATPLPRDAYCAKCQTAFCTGVCPHHHARCGPEAIVRIEERDGQHCVRCTGSELWFPDMESILGDPVGDDEQGEHLLLPVLRRTPGTCVQCGGQVSNSLSSHCSAPCAANHHREVVQRRERREARRAARELAKLQIDY